MKKHIICNVIANTKVGMGHIYRTISIANELSDDYNIVFTCKKDCYALVDKIVDSKYIIEIAVPLDLVSKYNPILVINDILNTEKKYIEGLRNLNIKTISFEDFGTGSAITNMTINDLYDEPLSSHDNIYWGHDYYFLREEFDNAKKRKFKDKINTVLILFGGTDPTNLTYTTLLSITDICKENNIEIQVLVGPGYTNSKQLIQLISTINYEKLFFTNSTNVVSKIMEQVDFAISSNGRTVYELAHMNIPAIIIPVNERESTHHFSTKQNGFINIGIPDENIEITIKNKFLEIISNKKLRHQLYLNTSYFDFSNNRKKIVQKIRDLIRL